MSDKTIPVYLHDDNGGKKQVGVAAEPDANGAQAIDIFDEFKETALTNVTVGDQELVNNDNPEGAPAGGVNAGVAKSEDVPAGSNAEPAEGALAEPVQNAPASRKDANRP